MHGIKKSRFNDPKRWRRRAGKARVLAEQMNDETSKKIMLRTAHHARQGISQAQAAITTRSYFALAVVTFLSNFQPLTS